MFPIHGRGSFQPIFRDILKDGSVSGQQHGASDLAPT